VASVAGIKSQSKVVAYTSVRYILNSVHTSIAVLA
jgi:hypothetical protein